MTALGTVLVEELERAWGRRDAHQALVDQLGRSLRDVLNLDREHGVEEWHAVHRRAEHAIADWEATR